MRTVWKYELPQGYAAGRPIQHDVPQGAELAGVRMDPGNPEMPVVYFVVTDGVPTVNRTFILMPTGHWVTDNCEHLGTVVTPGGAAIQVWEVKP